jgi:hypothetical protein
MWLDCYEAFVNMDKLDYVSFEFEDESTPTAYLYFSGRVQPLKLQADTLEEIVNYFAKWTVNYKNKKEKKDISKINAKSK